VKGEITREIDKERCAKKNATRTYFDGETMIRMDSLEFLLPSFLPFLCFLLVREKKKKRKLKRFFLFLLWSTINHLSVSKHSPKSNPLLTLQPSFPPRTQPTRLATVYLPSASLPSFLFFSPVVWLVWLHYLRHSLDFKSNSITWSMKSTVFYD
jgi:hypothetical protein